MGKLYKKLLVLIIVFILLPIQLPRIRVAKAYGPTVAGPNFDNVYIFSPLDGPAGLDAMKAGEIHQTSVWATETVEAAKEAGFKTFQLPVFMVEGFAFNLRRAPTNDIYFRRAMSALYNKVAYHNKWCAHYRYPAQSSVLDRYVGELWGCYNPVGPEEYPWHAYDPDLAIALLLAGGYVPKDAEGNVIPSPSPGEIDHWEYPNGTKIRKLYAYGTQDWPDVWDWLLSWTAEIQNIGIDVEVISEPEPMLESRMGSPPFDFDISYCFTWWSPPLYTQFYYHFHSDMAYAEGTFNWFGLANDTVDTLIDIITTSLDEVEVKQAIYDLQGIIADICPMVVQRAVECTRVCHPDLLSMMAVPDPAETRLTGYVPSSILPRWKNSFHGDFYSSFAYTPTNLNPTKWFTMGWGMYVLLSVQGRLAEINPITGEMVPWIAIAWNDTETWDGPWGPGQKITIWLRDDVTWHTGEPVTAYDIAFNLNYLAEHQIPDAYGVWWDLNHTNVVSPTQIEIYYNSASLSRMRELNIWALALYPPIWSQVTDPEGWNEWNDFYMEIDNGPLGTVRLSKLVGCGPYIFPEGGWDLTTNTIHLIANRKYFTTPLYTDINFDFEVDMRDYNTVKAALGSGLGDPEYSSIADINGDGIIDEDDLSLIEEDLGKTWGSRWPFTCLDLTVSPSEVEVGEEAIVTVTVENQGTAAGEYRVELIVNGEIEDAKNVTLEAGASTTVTFTISKDIPGDYTIEVGGKTATLTVTSPPPPTIPSWLYAIIVAAIIIIAIVIWRWRARKR